MTKQTNSSEALSDAGKARRAAMKKMAIGAAFTVPVVASFSMESMAGSANGNGYGANMTQQIP